MMSVDSGVETGNDSNDSLIAQPDNHVKIFRDYVTSSFKQRIARRASLPLLASLVNSDDDFSVIPKCRASLELAENEYSKPPHTIIEIESCNGKTNFFYAKSLGEPTKMDSDQNEDVPETSKALALCTTAKPSEVVDFRPFLLPSMYMKGLQEFNTLQLTDWDIYKNASENESRYRDSSTQELKKRPYKSIEFKPRYLPYEKKTFTPCCFSSYRRKLMEPCSIYNTEIDRLYSRIKSLVGQKKMYNAAITNNIDLMREWLNKGASPNTQDNRGRSPLHAASCRGYTEIVQLLLQHGANPNLRDCVGNTALHLAAVTNKLSVVTLLLEAGTDVLSLDRHGYNPLQLAQAKLRMLQCYNGSQCDMAKMKGEVQEILTMLMTYLKRQKDAKLQIEALSNICSNLSLSNTSDAVQDDVRNLLASIESLNLSN